MGRKENEEEQEEAEEGDREEEEEEEGAAWQKEKGLCKDLEEGGGKGNGIGSSRVLV